MKPSYALWVVLIVVLAALPLVIVAQDTPSPDNGDNLFVPLETVVPTIDIPLARTPTLDLIEYPTTPVATTDPCVDDDPDDLLVPLCPPTATARPQATTTMTEIVNGMWVLDPNSTGYTSSGQCQIPGGDNDGPSGQGEPLENLPRVPVCMTFDNQWLSVNSGDAFPRVMQGVYSQSEMTRELLMTNGVTSGTINLKSTREYRIISPTEIEFTYRREEQGGCTTESTLRYKLMEPNELVCSGVVITPIITATATTLPTPQPGETQPPPATPEPPFKEGRYIISLPLVDETCSADKMPESDTLTVSFTGSQDISITVGNSVYTLYWNGVDYYAYQEHNTFDLSLITYDDGAYFSWSKEGCFIGGNLILEGAPTATPLPVEPTLTAEVGAASIAGQQFSVSVQVYDYLCAADDLDLLPDLSSATLSAQADDTYILSIAGTDYVLTNYDGIYGYMEMAADGSMINMSMNGFYKGLAMGNFGVVTAEGKSCMVQLNYEPQ